MGDKAIHNGSNLSVSWNLPEGATAYNVAYYRVGGAHARAAWNHRGTSLTIRCDSRFPNSRAIVASSNTMGGDWWPSP